MIALAFAFATLFGASDRPIEQLQCCDNTVHVVTCVPGIECDLQLPGDDAVDAQRPPVADESQWHILPQSGVPAHIFFEPNTASSAPTLLSIPMLRRTYHVWLVASTHIGSVIYQMEAPPTPAPVALASLSSAPTPAPDLQLSGVYRADGRAPFRATRIGTDGIRTYIFLPPLQSYPTAIPVDDEGHTQAISYPVHMLADRSREYILPGVWNHVILSLGGGKHTVFLRYDRVQ